MDALWSLDAMAAMQLLTVVSPRSSCIVTRRTRIGEGWPGVVVRQLRASCDASAEAMLAAYAFDDPKRTEVPPDFKVRFSFSMFLDPQHAAPSSFIFLASLLLLRLSRV